MFNHVKKAFLPVLLVLTLVACAGSAPEQTEILWDTWGIPHIRARNAQELFYAFGWAQMESHGDLLLRLYGQARGRGAEYWGERYLAEDRWLHTMGIPDRSLEWYAAQKPEFQEYIDSFAAGINDYAREHPELISDDVNAVLPVSGFDVAAHALRVVITRFITSPGIVRSAERALPAGSNGWAVAPSRSASGNTLLLANPHLPWSDLYLWYEAQLTAPGYSAYGVAFVGTPILEIAFNDRLGWTHTVNTLDGADTYELTLEEGGYLFDGEVKPFAERASILRITQPGGGVREEELTVRSSVHGPVIAQRGDRAIALRVVGLNQSGIFEQWWDMGRAKNLRQFERALSHLQIPMFTVIYADSRGHIMHLFNGRVPVRNEGDWSYWRGVIPGNDSEALWTGTHPYSELPRVIDPPGGWLQNANDPPWTTTIPFAIDPSDYPPYMAPGGMSFRPQRSARMLAGDENITFEEFVEYKLSTRMELADRILDDLIPAATEIGGAVARRAADILESWDREADSDSRGAVLFNEWVRRAGISRLFAVGWSEDSPLTTPDGLADPEGAVAALESAAGRVEERFGALDVPWGDLYRFRAPGIDLPANGGSGSLGIFRVIDFIPDSDGLFRAYGGDSFVAAVEFSDPVRARAALSYGNATQAHSRHAWDQLELLARKELRPVWLTPEEIEANLEERIVLEPGIGK